MCAIAIILLAQINTQNKYAQQHELPVELLSGTQSEIAKRDCDLELVYSTNDQQCNIICRQPNLYVSRNGACVNELVGTDAPQQYDCDAKHGVVTYILGDPEFGKTKLFCLSIDPGIQPDNVQDTNIICKNGSIFIDYIESFPQLTNCKCPSTSPVLALIESTSVVREHGVCVTKNMERLYAENNLVMNHQNNIQWEKKTPTSNNNYII